MQVKLLLINTYEDFHSRVHVCVCVCVCVCVGPFSEQN